MKGRGGTLLLVLVLVLTACGGAKKHDVTFDNAALGVDVAKKLRVDQPLVCSNKSGYLASIFDHSYNRVCGIRRDQPSVYVSLDAKRATWCAVSPRVAHTCR